MHKRLFALLLASLTCVEGAPVPTSGIGPESQVTRLLKTNATLSGWAKPVLGAGPELVMSGSTLTINTNQLVVTNSNVGIGTLSPVSKLDVVGSVGVGVNNIASSDTNRGTVLDNGAMFGLANQVYSWNNLAAGTANYVDGKITSTLGNANIASADDSVAAGNRNVLGRRVYSVASQGVDDPGLGIGNRAFVIVAVTEGDITGFFPNALYDTNTAYLLATYGATAVATNGFIYETAAGTPVTPTWSLQPYMFVKHTTSETSFTLTKILKATYSGAGTKIYYDSATEIYATIGLVCSSYASQVAPYGVKGGNGHFAGGLDNSTWGYGAVAVGHGNRAWNHDSYAQGRETRALGVTSHAQGDRTIAAGETSTSMGRGISVYGDYSFGIALNNQTGTAVSNANVMSIMGGNVGIGTVAPSDIFQVVAGANRSVLVGSASTYSTPQDFSTGGVFMAFSRPDGGAPVHGFYSYDTPLNAKNNFAVSSRDDLVFLAGDAGFGSATERMRLLGNGNVGIGAPLPGNLLVLNKAIGNNYISFELADVVKTFIGISSTNNEPIVGMTSGDFGFRVDTNDFFISTDGGNSAQLVVTTNKNVGIGETVPGSKLSVSGGGSFGSGYDTITAPTGGLIIEGNVGIGTANPGHLLTLNKLSGNNYLHYQLGDVAKAYVGVSSAADEPVVGMTAGDFGFRVDTNDFFVSTDGGNSAALVISSNRNVGIGTIGPLALLTVSNSAGPTVAVEISSVGTNDLLRLASGVNRKLTVTTNGNVGIGTAAPDGKLNVMGNVDALSYLWSTDGLEANYRWQSQLSGNDLNFISRNTAQTALFLQYADGFIGIGTVTPTNRLDVAGHTSLRSNLWAFNLGSNGTVVSLLGRDANSKIVETAIPSASGEANTASSLGAGWPVTAGKSGVDLRFNSITNGNGAVVGSNNNVLTVSANLVAGANITLTTNSQIITITASTNTGVYRQYSAFTTTATGTTEDSVLSGATASSGSLTIPANTLNVGSVIKFRLSGSYSTGVTPGTIVVKPYFAGTQVDDSTARTLPVSISGGQNCEIECELLAWETGGNYFLANSGRFSYEDSTGVLLGVNLWRAGGSYGFDRTIANTFDLKVTFSNAGTAATFQTVVVELLK